MLQGGNDRPAANPPSALHLLAGKGRLRGNGRLHFAALGGAPDKPQRKTYVYFSVCDPVRDWRSAMCAVGCSYLRDCEQIVSSKALSDRRQSAQGDRRL